MTKGPSRISYSHLFQKRPKKERHRSRIQSANRHQIMCLKEINASPADAGRIAPFQGSAALFVLRQVGDRDEVVDHDQRADRVLLFPERVELFFGRRVDRAGASHEDPSPRPSPRSGEREKKLGSERAAASANRGFELVPTLRVGMPSSTLCVADKDGGRSAVHPTTRSVRKVIPTRSVGTSGRRWGRGLGKTERSLVTRKMVAFRSRERPHEPVAQVGNL
jgi:hypothetical protein